MSEAHMRKREEWAIVAPHRGRFEVRVVAEFLVASAAWIAVVIAGVADVIPLWLGMILNAAIATLFYMPMHEATHGNIWGDHRSAKWGEDLIGMLCAIPLLFSYKAHRLSHMRHHAYTNDHDRDPDIYVAGPLWRLPISWFGVVVFFSFLPLFALVPPMQRILPASVRKAIRIDTGGKRAERYTVTFWFTTTGVLVAAAVAGFGWEAFLLWYVPGRLAVLWLQFIFAWFPHHPHGERARYRDTRVATFAGSTVLVRGHDHHLLHHLYPRVAHYRLPDLWGDIGPLLIERGARVEGRAAPERTPIAW